MYNTLRHTLWSMLFMYTCIHGMQHNSQQIEQHQSGKKEHYIVYSINKDHEKIVYPNRTIPTPKRNRQGMYKCTYCEQEYNAHNTILNHMRHKHVRRTIHQCTHCPYSSSIKHNVEEHIYLSHYNEKQYCETCDVYIRSLSQHQKGIFHKQNYEKSVKDRNEKEEKHYDVLSDISNFL